MSDDAIDLRETCPERDTLVPDEPRSDTLPSPDMLSSFGYKIANHAFEMAEMSRHVVQISEETAQHAAQASAAANRAAEAANRAANATRVLIESSRAYGQEIANLRQLLENHLQESQLTLLQTEWISAEISRQLDVLRSAIN